MAAGYRSQHNQHVNDLRRTLREGVEGGIDDMAAVLTVPATATAALQLRDLDRAMACLPAEQRQVILLVGLEGMHYEEVASILRVPIGTVRSRLSRGRETLRRLTDVKPESERAARGSDPRRGARARRRFGPPRRAA
jgi:RNA polymerase sigma-70 factor (ECF subfamily)